MIIFITSSAVMTNGFIYQGRHWDKDQISSLKFCYGRVYLDYCGRVDPDPIHFYLPDVRICTSDRVASFKY